MRFLAAALCAAAAIGPAGFAQAPVITKIDPPNWWVNMPAPMLLVKGEHLAGAQFSLSGGLRAQRVSISQNGHWAELWLQRDAVAPASVTISAQTAQGRATAQFRFDARRPSADGFAGFSSRDVMYLIMTDRFADGDSDNDGEGAHDPPGSQAAQQERTKPKGWHGGDVRGVLQHLDYLQALGIDTVWLTPVYQNHSPEAYHGYHATDMYAMDEHFGSLDDLKALSKAMHARGMKLVLDTVPNHVGPMHPWVQDEPEPTWFHGTKAAHRIAKFDFQPLTSPYAPWRDQRDVTEGWFVDLLPDNNQANASVAKYLTQNAIWWTEQAALDGLRIDTFPYVDRAFWGPFHASLKALYPRLTTVGEISDGDPRLVSTFAGGVTRTGVDTGLWSPLDFPMHFAIRNAFTGASSMKTLAETLQQDQLYPHPERLVPFLDNHDLIRIASEPGGTMQAQKQAMAFLLTVRGMPHLYAGNEIAMEGGPDPDDRRDFPGGFPSAGHSAFDGTTRTPAEKEMFDWTSGLLALRNRTAALQTGSMQVLYSSDDAIVFVRGALGGRVLVAIRRGGGDGTLRFNAQDTVAATGNVCATVLGEGSCSREGDDLVLRPGAGGVLIADLH